MHRSLSPLTDAGWSEVAAEATRVLRQRLAGRKVVEFSASGDWADSAVALGRIGEATALGEARLVPRLVAPMVEVRVDFALRRSELDALDRGAQDMDTQPIIAAAAAAAKAEDSLVFGGSGEAGLPGVAAASTQPELTAEGGIIAAVAGGIEALRDASVAGPYALALGPDLWVQAMAGSDRGYPVMSHLKLLLEGAEPVWAPSLDGALLVSRRGGDFAIRAGQDWSIGYDSHDAVEVNLYLQESLTVLVNTPEAAVRIAGAGS